MDKLETIAGTPVWVTHWGHEGARVVMVHGSAQGSEVGGDRHFSAQKRLAGRGWQVIVPDRPGHGRSPSPGRPDDAQADGALVAELLGDGAHLVGHSFGGAVALAAAALRPGAVRSLTLIEPAMQMLAIDDPLVRRFGLRILAIRLFSLSAASRARKFSQLVGIPDEIGGSRPPQEMQRMGVALGKLKLPGKAELQQQLATIRQAGIPLWVVTGGWSPAFEVVADRVAAAGGGTHQVIASPHHFPQMVSDEFNDSLVRFMQRASNT